MLPSTTLARWLRRALMSSMWGGNRPRPEPFVWTTAKSADVSNP